MRGLNKLFSSVLAGHSTTKPLVSINAAVASTSVVPGVVPTAPGPSDVFKEGANCTFAWTPDPAGLWKETNVELMSGDNFQMIHITTVATFDGTDKSLTSYSYPCPDVTPNSAIYFYQFSTSAAPANLTWTTRFTIAGADGSTTPPANSTQPNGAAIPWGVGALADPSTATPPPSYLSSGTSSSSSASASASSSSSSSSGSASSSVSASSATSSSITSSASETSSSSSSGAVVVTTSTVTPSGSQASQTGSADTNGNGALAAQANLVAGAVAVGLTAVVFGLMS